MHGLVLLDATDRVLRPAILWNDQRTGAECAEIEERVGFERLVALTGNRALPGFTAPKLVWVRKHEPEVWSQAAHVLLPKDYVRLRLTGERAIDAAEASGTLLFDVAGRRWSDEVCDALEIPTEWLPPAAESTAIGGAGDQQAGALGVGVVGPGPLSVVLGTSGVVFAALPGYQADPEARVHVFCHAVPDTWEAMGVMLSAAGSLRWLRDVVGGDVRRAGRRGRALAGRDGGAHLPPLPAGRAHAACGPVRPGHVRGTVTETRPRRTRPFGAGGRRVRPARLARAAEARSGSSLRSAALPAAAPAASSG